VGKNKHSLWAQEVQYQEIYDDVDSGVAKTVLTDAYEALTRFCQKEQRRGKDLKKRGHCWQ